MSTKPVTTTEGLMGLKFTLDETRHPIFQKIRAAIIEEHSNLLLALEHPSDIATTTLLRGECRLAKRISARLEVGPESRQSEPMGPESASSASAAGGFPLTFEQ